MQLLACRQVAQGILVDDADYGELAPRRINWNGRRGAYFYVNRKKVYVHRWIYAQMLPESDHWRLEGKNVGFRDRDPTNCQRNNLFVWQSDLKTKQSRVLAKREALRQTLELEHELFLQNRSAS